MSVFLWSLNAAKAGHNAAVGLNNIIVTDVVGFRTSNRATKTIEAAEQHTGVYFL